jgi:hypothetical protein
MFLLVVSEFFSEQICDIVGIVYPAYMSYVAVETREGDDGK